jgi:DNA-binding response OmpR family regulator
VPASRKSATGTAPRPSVLLIEEYDALAVAIGSALKKFAPAHEAHVVRSLAEAEVVARETRPELFIVDFDPPQSGIIAFLNKMKMAHADARLLVIAAGTARELAAMRGLSGAIQFIEKPFELADFGAAVQALLGPWTARGAETLRGSLRHLDLVDVTALVCIAGATTTIRVDSADEGTGEVNIVDGYFSHAIAEEESGVDALERMLLWREARFTEMNARTKSPRTIHGPWRLILLEALRKTSATRMPEQGAPETIKPAPRTGKKIMVIDDTEMLSIFVEDILTIADPDWQIFTASSGNEGIKRTESLLPDLVLLDYSMPDLKGDAVCRQLLGNDKTARIPVIMMSGHVLEMSAVSVQLRNVVATIEKPFFSDALLSLVRQTLATGPLPISERPAKSEPAKVVEQIPPPPTAKTQTDGKRFIAAVSKTQSIPTSQSVVPESAAIFPARAEPAVSLPRAQFAFSSDNDVVLGLFLEVISMQLTPMLQMGAIRARPSSLAVSLHVKSESLRGRIPLGTGFELGRLELDVRGKIETIRLVPTRRPVEQIATRNAFDIGGVAIVSTNAHENVQLTSAPNAPMTMQLLAEYEIGAVELSSTFEVSALVLKPRGQKAQVRFTSTQPPGDGNGAQFETAVVRLDEAARISELLLNRAA